MAPNQTSPTEQPTEQKPLVDLLKAIAFGGFIPTIYLIGKFITQL